LIFQEQIALLAHKLGGLTLDEGNMLRKVLTKKGLNGSKAFEAKKLATKLVDLIPMKLKLFLLVASFLSIEESETGKSKLFVKRIKSEMAKNKLGVWREELRE
jgi:hypothetical protein